VTVAPETLLAGTRAPGLARRGVQHPIVRLLIRRLLGLVAVLFAVMVAVFFMVKLVPGDPITGSFGMDVTPEQMTRLRAELGLDQPIYVQFWEYVKDAVRFDFGRSFQNSQPVGELVRQRIGVSLELALSALAIVLLVSIPLGIIAGALTREGRHRKLELGFAGTTSILGSIPDYLTATILAFLFAVNFRIFPVAGADSLKALVLPATAVALAPTMTMARIVRVETLNVLAQDYIRTARSQRLPARLIYFRHLLPNVLTAALTIGGLILASVIGGAVIVEAVFNRPGLGSALVASVLNKDYPVVQGVTLVLATCVVVINTIVDILLGFFDPRSLAKSS
jgi:peptide/nickel transport system permease protein